MKKLITFILIFGLFSYSNIAFSQEDEQEATEVQDDTSSAVVMDSATEIMNTVQFVEE